MPRGPSRSVLGLIARYVVLLAVLALVTASAFVAVDAGRRPAVLRVAVAALAAIVLIDLYGPLRRRLDQAPRSEFEEARRQQPAGPKVAPMLLRLRESVQSSVASQRYFEEALWPRLVRLSEARGSRARLDKLHGRPWLGRGPSLAAIADLIRRIGDER